MIAFQIIAAVDQELGIGKGGKLPWHLPSDLKHFNRITTSGAGTNRYNIMIMGRRTWDSLPTRYKPLPDRINWVISRNAHLFLPAEVSRFATFNEALEAAPKHYDPSRLNCYVIGGAQIYHTALQHPQCQKLYITHLLKVFGCDTFFPDALSRFKMTAKSDIYQENNVSFFFAEYIPASA